MTANHHDTFTIERIYPSRRADVWAAWAIPAKKSAWFGSDQHSLDFRPGGAERHVFTNDMGEHVNETRYFEIAENERIVFAYSMAMNGRIHTVSLATVTFADHEDGTRLVYNEQMCVIPPSDGAPGRQGGWTALLGRLGESLDAGA